MSFLHWLQRREIGSRPKFGDKDFVMRRVYQSVECYHHWNDLSDRPTSTSEYGAVFNLEFSPEGTVVVAACEKKSIVLFDAITSKQINQVTDAHTDNVNCIRFLNDRMFATCSDDTTVALWDLRYLKMKMRSLHGHSNWVKNIEYSLKDNLLVTSGFDGGIFTWDINSQTEQGLIYQKVFHTSGLMRCRITPDGSKLVICTTGGYLMVIHNLELTSLHKDLCGFRPSIYRLMQTGQQYIPQAAKFDHVFSKKQLRNRVELITDFPEENDAEVILALQVHPMGHSILSRNISYDELTEWSCIHDIYEGSDDETESPEEPTLKRKRLNINESDEIPRHTERDGTSSSSSSAPEDMFFSINRRQRGQRARFAVLRIPAPPPAHSNNNNSSSSATSSGTANSTNAHSASVRIPAPPPAHSNNNNSSSSATSNGNANPTNAHVVNRPEFVPDIWAAEVTVQERAIRQNRARSSNSVTGYNFVYAISSGVLPAAAAAITTRVGSNRLVESTHGNPNNRNDSSHSHVSETYQHVNSSNRSVLRFIPTNFSQHPVVVPTERKIFQNPKKLMFYIQESNKGKGFIKEPCFSADGRIICSPYSTGVRLLGFSENCSEYPITQTFTKRSPRPLTEIKLLSSHSDIVLSSKFSPREPLLVTGDRSGKVVWYHANL